MGFCALMTFAFCSPAHAQVTVGTGGTGTTANTGASGRILIGQGNSTFLEKAMSGDCTIAATGAITCTASGSDITFDIGDDGGNDSTDVNELATTGDTNGVFTEPSADKVLVDLTKDWPKSDQCDALAANGGNCSAGSYARGVDTAGVAESCTADDDSPDSDSEVPNGITVDLSASGIVSGGTANKCAEFDASGFLTSSADACGSGGGGVTGPGSSNDNGIARFDGTDGAVIQDSTGCTIDDSGNLVCTSVEGDCTPASNDCGMTTDDNSADHAAPGAGLTVWYSKAGEPWIRAGAAGTATAICLEDGTNCPASGGGDSISIDSVGVTDPDFQDGGDINFTDTSNVVTATLKDDVVAAAEMADADHGDISWSGGVATLDADVVAAAEMADADHGQVSWSAGVATVEDMTCTNCIDDTEVTTNAGTALSADLEEDAHCAEHDGRSTTCNSEVLDADAELYTDSGCTHILSPASSAQYPTVWIAPVAVTITSIYCEVTAGTSVAADVNVDDGTPAGVNGSDITCDTTGVTDSTLAGDTGMAAGDRLDVDIGTVTGSVTNFSICITYTKDD